VREVLVGDDLLAGHWREDSACLVVAGRRLVVDLGMLRLSDNVRHRVADGRSLPLVQGIERNQSNVDESRFDAIPRNPLEQCPLSGFSLFTPG